MEHTHHYVQPKCCLEPHNEVGSQCQSPPSPLVGLKLRTFQFYVLCDIPLNLYQEINPSHNTTLIWNQNLLNYHKVLYTPPPPPLILEDGVHVMTLPNQLAPKQIANLQTMTAWLQNPTKHLSKDLSLIGCIQMLVPSLSPRNKVLVITVKNYTKHISKSPYPVRFWLISLLSSKYFVQNCRSL